MGRKLIALSVLFFFLVLTSKLLADEPAIDLR